MTKKTITEPVRKKLRAPLPSEAVSPHPTKSYLSTIKAIYVVERLNDVFGVGSWHVENEVIEGESKMVVVKSKLTIPEYEICIEQFGGNDNADKGDAYKGACTDALTKICSYLEIGIDVFKGLSDTPSKRPQSSAVKEVFKSSDTAGPVCPKCKNGMIKELPSKFGSGKWYPCSDMICGHKLKNKDEYERLLLKEIEPGEHTRPEELPF